MSAAAKPQPPQLVLDLAHRQARGLEDFLVSRSNAAAVELIDRWPSWPHPAALVSGAEGAGKSHLANVWAEKANAPNVLASVIDDATVELLARHGTLVIEDVDRPPIDERVIFHLLNLAREKGLSILLTSRKPAGDIAISLPDLRSRLRALPMVVIEPPDEVLLKAVLVKLFADRRLEVEPHVVAHLALHLDRSMQAASLVVEKADRLALAQHRRVTRAIAAEALASLGQSSEND